MELNNKFKIVKSILIIFLLIFVIAGFNSVSAHDDNDLYGSPMNFIGYQESDSMRDSGLILDSEKNKLSYDNNLDDVDNLMDSDLIIHQDKSSFAESNSKDSTGLTDSAGSTNSNNELSDVILTTNDLTATYKSKNFTATLTDSSGNPIVGAQISFIFPLNTYNRTTDSNGTARLKINSAPGNYTIITKFLGDDNYSSSTKTNSIVISKKKLTITSSNLSKKYGSSNRFQVKITDNGVGVANITVAMTLSSKTFYRTTNANGIASLSIGARIGKYTIKSVIRTNKYYYSNKNTNNITVRSQNPYKLSILKWGSKGNIKKNTRLYKNLVKSGLTNSIVSACKKGTPLIKFGNGSGKKVFILAGVHGNELSSQAAAFKLINTIYNAKYKINGTIYIVPVLSPKSAELNIRNTGKVEINSVADKKGTLPYKLVSYVKSLKVDGFGDFHTTRPGGKPGKNVAMGTYSPTKKSATLAKYIAKTTGYSYLIYKKAGAEYPGAIEDVLNLAKIPSVTCEVITPHGKIASGSIGKSLNLMKALLKYYGNNIS